VTRSWLPAAAASVGIFVIALAFRLEQHHTALLYPDGYQYLLMARGISEHFEPTTVLGPGGELFVPNADAAAKPVFPLLVALVHALGVGWLTAAMIVTSSASAAVVALTFLLATRLGGTWIAGAAAALVLLASPSLAFWSGFSGPDPLAQALALAAALAFLHERPVAGGVLLGLAVATRPEFAIVALGVFLVLAATRRRRAALHGVAALAATCGLLLVVLRPPVALPPGAFLATALILVFVCVAAALLPRERMPAATVALTAVAALGFASAAGLADLWDRDWILVAAALIGLSLATLDPDRRGHASRIVALGVALGAVYWMKNPGADRYFAVLLPLAALLVGLGIAAAMERWRFSVVPAVTAIVAIVALGISGMPSTNHDQDVFSRTAQRLEPMLSQSEALVTAAPDAYGFWLPEQPVRTMRPGAHGFILLDPAQRSYAPHLAANGKIVARVASDFAFSRPDGEIDAGVAVVVSGRVTQGSGRPDAERTPAAVR
jgi:hypothetical protein